MKLWPVVQEMTCCNVLYVSRFQKWVKKMGNRSEFHSERNYYLQNWYFSEETILVFITQEETIWNFQTFMNSKKNICQRNYMRKYGICNSYFDYLWRANVNYWFFAAETIQWRKLLIIRRLWPRKLFKGGNYSQKYSIYNPIRRLENQSKVKKQLQNFDTGPL